MAHDKSARAKVRAKYVQGAPLTAAAAACKVPYATARNWKRADTDAGSDWDIERNAALLSQGGIESMTKQVLAELATAFLATLQLLKEDQKIKSGERAKIMVQLMDGYSKAISAASKAMPNANRLAVAMDVMRFWNAMVAQRYPKMRSSFLEMTQACGEDFVREFGARV